MKKILNGPNLLLALIAFVLFMVAACAAHYLTAGVFVSARLALLYAALGLLGALALLFHRRVFSIFFYIGCALGWLTGHFVAGLQGEFAPTAGVICTFFLIAALSLIGGVLDYKLWKHRRAKEKDQREKQRQADETREADLLARQAAKVEAAPSDAALTAPEVAAESEALTAPAQKDETHV